MKKGRHPFQFDTVHEYQIRNGGLQSCVNSRQEYQRHLYGSKTLVTYCKDGEEPRICIPDEMLSRSVKQFKSSCFRVTCQKNKRGWKTYGQLAPREAVLLPWQEIHCDSIGPWKIDLRARNIEFKAMTIIDPATNLIEIQPLLNGIAIEAADVVEDTWIARYPRPVRCITDNGPEFGQEFRDRLEKNLGIKVRSSTARNPQGNPIVERIHQSVGLILRVITPEENPRSFEDGKRVIRRCLATAIHACRCASSGAIGDLSPGALAFHRDMLLDIPMQTDITILTTNRQGMIDRNLLKANAKRVKHDYAVDEKVLKQVSLGLSDKLKPSYTGPYRISTVHTKWNGYDRTQASYL
ncbi:integrase core domain containing protein [Nitzschia inconspicua]|uniref:Integrase core domain containing protein n=1 Tax=Nitzschia inconspicua TaxID=303405 RepID=A0A9K3M1V3_9STRA|nr:integrase core domain containing protein [Nitzschia inconspicua]